MSLRSASPVNTSSAENASSISKTSGLVTSSPCTHRSGRRGRTDAHIAHRSNVFPAAKLYLANVHAFVFHILSDFRREVLRDTYRGCKSTSTHVREAALCGQRRCSRF